MSGTSSINSLVTADMASAVKVIPSFSGLPEEDISSWVANASFLISLYSLCEGDAIKVRLLLASRAWRSIGSENC